MKRSSWVKSLMILAMIPGYMVFANQNEEKVFTQPTVISSSPIQVGKNTIKQVFYEDLDGNGTKEKIVLLVDYDEPSGAYALTLKINDHQMILAESWMGGDVNGNIIDIDQKDKRKEIAIGGDLCSSDYATYFYSYENGKVELVGNTQGTIKPAQLDKVYHIVIPGDGTLQTYMRGNVLQTWYHDACYKLDSKGKLMMQPEDYYRMETPVTLLQRLKVYETPSLEANVMKTFEVGEKVTLMLTDDQVWCQLVDAYGNEGWFNLKEAMCIEVDGNVYWSWEVFDGLFLAD